jgi:uncharacterized protein YbgA (DUF1722 family)/uncharacterized protein YbbK (DUF523 family)
MGSDPEAAIRPVVVVSRCLLSENCRWNGEILHDDFALLLKRFVDYRPICPEVEIGLGVPRDPIHIESIRGEPHLVQAATGRDLSRDMRLFSDSFLSRLNDVDGFLLKYRSPSCGTNDVKIYGQGAGSGSIGKGAGFFAAGALKRFGDLAIESEGRVKNFRLREHYLTKLWVMARFKRSRSGGGMRDLIEFHADNKLLLMAYNQARLKELGKVVANHERRKVEEVFDLYRAALPGAFAKIPRLASSINVLMHAMGYFTKELSARERSHFLGLIERYRSGTLPLSALVSIVNSWIARFDEPYLARQTFFNPYPEELALIADSGKGRDL